MSCSAASASIVDALTAVHSVASSVDGALYGTGASSRWQPSLPLLPPLLWFASLTLAAATPGEAFVSVPGSASWFSSAGCTPVPLEEGSASMEDVVGKEEEER